MIYDTTNLKTVPTCKDDANEATYYEITRIINYAYRTGGLLEAYESIAEITTAFAAQGRSQRSDVISESFVIEVELSEKEPCRFHTQERDEKTGEIVKPPKDADPAVPIVTFDVEMEMFFRIEMKADGVPRYTAIEEFPGVRFASE